MIVARHEVPGTGVWTFPESGDLLARGFSQKVAKITKSEFRRANDFLSRRDSMIVARHEVPGTEPPSNNRPVGYGLILAGVRTLIRRLQYWNEKAFRYENRSDLCVQERVRHTEHQSGRRSRRGNLRD
jgi:hypothetical protein